LTLVGVKLVGQRQQQRQDHGFPPEDGKVFGPVVKVVVVVVVIVVVVVVVVVVNRFQDISLLVAALKKSHSTELYQSVGKWLFCGVCFRVICSESLFTSGNFKLFLHSGLTVLRRASNMSFPFTCACHCFLKCCVSLGLGKGTILFCRLSHDDAKK
jgi:hypothetical protein